VDSLYENVASIINLIVFVAYYAHNCIYYNIIFCDIL